MHHPVTSLRHHDYAFVRAALLDRRELALLDVREEDPHARATPTRSATARASLA